MGTVFCRRPTAFLQNQFNVVNSESLTRVLKLALEVYIDMYIFTIIDLSVCFKSMIRNERTKGAVGHIGLEFKLVFSWSQPVQQYSSHLRHFREAQGCNWPQAVTRAVKTLCV